jgi:hypothetical protein
MYNSLYKFSLFLAYAELNPSWLETLLLIAENFTEHSWAYDLLYVKISAPVHVYSFCSDFCK